MGHARRAAASQKPGGDRTGFVLTGEMLMLMKYLIAAVAIVAVTPAMAQDAGSDGGIRFSAAVTGGTLGIGPEVGARFSDHVGVRASATFLGVSGDIDPDDITYDGKLKLESYGLMADIYPLGEHFRISAGARINKNRARVSATPATDVDVGDDTYTPAQIGTLRGRAEVKKFAPAVTVGWSGGNRRGFMFGFDAGVLFQGSVRIREFTSTGSLSNNAAFRANLEAERRDVQDDVDDYKLYPIVQFSIGYRF